MKWALLVGMAVMTVLSYLAPPAKNFMEPELARVIFFHLPSAFSTVIFVVFGAYCAARFLLTKQFAWEHRSLAAIEIGTLHACVTMLTGILFSKVQWGAWWHWDPRQTSFLIALMFLGAYFALRMAFEDETIRARNAAAYSTLTIFPILFLIFVFPRLATVQRNSLHPSTTIQQGGFSTDYWTIILGIFALMLVLSAWLYRMAVKVATIQQQVRNYSGNLEATGGRSAAHRVDRVLPLQQ